MCKCALLMLASTFAAQIFALLLDPASRDLGLEIEQEKEVVCAKELDCIDLNLRMEGLVENDQTENTV